MTRTDRTLAGAKFLVVRAAAHLPDGWMPPELDGRWFEVGDIRAGAPTSPAILTTEGDSGAQLRATGRFETNDRGQAAEVYELWP